MADKVQELVKQAASMIEGASLWRAYVAVESAILNLKLRNSLEGQKPPPAPERTANKEELIMTAKNGLAALDLSGDKKKLLYDLRVCRDALKAAVAKS